MVELIIRASIVFILLFTVACDEVTTHNTSQSPDNRYVAAFYSISGGGAAGWVSMRVNLRKPADAFKINEYVFEMTRGYEGELSWKSASHLVVTYPAEAIVKQQEEKWKDLTISYERKPSKGGMFVTP